MYNTPFIEQRADPQIYLHEGIYYMTASVPEYDRIELRCAKHISDLPTAKVKNIWYKHNEGEQSELIWAPEIHYVEDSFYIYFAAAPSTEQDKRDNTFKHRMYALKCSGDNPMLDEWLECGQIKTNMDSFSLDATVLNIDLKNYYIWAQKEIGSSSNSNIYISEMINPTTLSDKQICISKPEFEWEMRGFSVNEGPYCLVHDQKIYLTISCSATDENYCIGALHCDLSDDVTNPSSWTKIAMPLMQSDIKNSRFGPGHNSFVKDGDGSTLIIYHCRPSRVSVEDALFNPNRDMCIQQVAFDKENNLVLGTPKLLSKT